MSQIQVMLDQTLSENNRLEKMKSRISEVENRISSMRHQVDGSITARRGIDRRFQQAGMNLSQLEKRVQSMYNFIEYAMESYLNAEKQIKALKEKQFGFEHKKTFWGQISGGFGKAIDVVDAFGMGLTDAVVGTVEGLYTMVAHPVETFKGIAFVVQHPVQAGTAMWQAVEDSWKTEVANGDAENRSRWFGRAIGEVALSVVGTKGVDKAAKALKVGKVIEETGGVRIAAKSGSEANAARALNGEVKNPGSVSAKGASEPSTIGDYAKPGSKAGKLGFNNTGEYFDYISQIGKQTDLTNEQKLAKIQEAYEALEIKGDVTVISDIKFLKPEGFGANGRMIVDWPNDMGFVKDSIKSISRDTPLPEQWDRIGGKAGENFTTLPSNGVPNTYDQRAIPYLENASARHVGTFDNSSYFDALDTIKSGDLDELNRIVTANGKIPISHIDFDDISAHYKDFQKNIKEVIGDIDGTYGVKGTAAPWFSSSTGMRLMNGGAEQIVTPINAEMLERIGVIPKY